MGLSLVEARQQHRKNWVVVADAADGGILLLLQLLWFGRIITPALDYELDLARQMRRRNMSGLCTATTLTETALSVQVLCCFRDAGFRSCIDSSWLFLGFVVCLKRSFVWVVSLSVGFAFGEFADSVLLLHSCYYDRDDCLMSCVFFLVILTLASNGL